MMPDQKDRKGEESMIIVGYDGSKVAEEVLALAKKHAKGFGWKVVIITSMKGGADIPRDDFIKAEKLLARAEADFKDEEIPCETHLSVRGLEPGEDLVKFAEETGAREILIGVKRRSKVGKLLFGSNAQYTILNAPCPVVSIR